MTSFASFLFRLYIGSSLFCAWPDGTENDDQDMCVCSAAQAHWLVALGWKSYHVSEFPKAAKNKMPDPITKAAFFTESKSPPEPSCAPRRRGGRRKETSMLVIVCNVFKLLFPLYIWLDYKKQHHELGRHVARYGFASVGKTWAEHKKQHESFFVVVQNQIKEILCCGYIKCRCESTKQWSDHLYRWFSLLLKLVSPYIQAFQVMAEDKRARFLFCFFLLNTRCFTELEVSCTWGVLVCIQSLQWLYTWVKSQNNSEGFTLPWSKNIPQRSSCLSPG